MEYKDEWGVVDSEVLINLNKITFRAVKKTLVFIATAWSFWYNYCVQDIVLNKLFQIFVHHSFKAETSTLDLAPKLQYKINLKVYSKFPNYILNSKK